MRRDRRSSALVVLVLPFALALPVRAATPSRASEADRAKIEKVLSDYRAAWLANDSEGVLRLFTDDTVLMPHHGVAPVVGKAAARAFWFPTGPPTVVTLLEQTVDGIGGTGELAYARGRSKVEWITGTGAGAKRFDNAGTFLTLFRRQPNGSWRICLQMWDDPPNQTR
jgi:uncharacterized protein (TIGR02246 family)